ncbi:MAG: helix-turn-helix domain-containing protein [Planctomycetota bacterium]
MQEQKEYLTSEEVMSLLNIARPTLYLWVKLGKLTPIKMEGKLLRFSRLEIERLLPPNKTGVYAWVSTSNDKAKAIAEIQNHLNGQPEYKFIYLDESRPDRFKARILIKDTKSGKWIDPGTAPGGMTLRGVTDLHKKGGYIFLGTQEPWQIESIRIENDGCSNYIAIWVDKVK